MSCGHDAAVWREQRPACSVEVRADGLVVVEVVGPLDDDAVRDLSAAPQHAANKAETIRRPPRPIHEPDV